VRACDWLPGRGMPREAFDPEKKCLPLCELYNDDDEDGLPSPGARSTMSCAGRAARARGSDERGLAICALGGATEEERAMWTDMPQDVCARMLKVSRTFPPWPPPPRRRRSLT
jgi:hypothetical protein